MLTYITAEHHRLNPLQFDQRAMLRASNFLLGKARTDALMKDKTPKSTLLMISLLEAEAERVRKDPESAMPADAPTNGAGTRKVIAEEILQWRQLHLNATQEMQLPYRLRGENQRKAILENRVAITKTDGGTRANVTVSLKDLKHTVEEAERTGRCQVSILLNPEDAEFVQNSAGNAVVSLNFQDELAERPETKRAWLGNVAHRCEVKAKAEGTLPIDELQKIGATNSGKSVLLARGAKMEGIKLEDTADGRVKVTLDIAFPEIEKALKENDLAGKGMITDGTLRVHAANLHGCNGRDFVEASAEVAKELVDNAYEAAKKWLGEENRPGLLEDFVKDYAAVALTMRPRLRPQKKLEPARSRITKVEEIIATQKSSEGIYALETLKNVEPTGASCPASAGAAWLNAFSKREIESTWNNETAVAYETALEEKFGIKKSIEKSQMIHENFLAQGEALDGGPEKIILPSIYLTEEMDEEFNLEKEIRDQEIFDSKAEDVQDEASGAKKTELDKMEWLEEKGTVELSLSAQGPMLHRLKRYKNRRSGLGISRSRAERFDAEISMPKKNPMKWAGPTLRIENLLTEKGREDLEEVRRNGEEWEQRDLKEIGGLLADWQSSLRRLDPLGKNPMEAKVLDWLTSVSENKEGALCDSLEELRSIFGPTLKNTGKVPYEWDRSPEDLSMPARSSALPLKLLCGGGTKELASVKEDPAKLWDMMMRWQCAATLEEEALPEREELRVQALAEALADGSLAKMVSHAIALELSEKPATLAAYLNEIGLPNGVGSLPAELSDMADIVGTMGSSPNVAVFKGEETNLTDLASVLESNGVNLDLSEKENAEVAHAVDKALEAWRGKLIDAVGALEKTEAPTGKDCTISIVVNTRKETGEINDDPFAETRDVLYEEMPKAKGDIETIAMALLINNPKNLTVIAGTEEVNLTLGSGKIWSTSSDSPTATIVAVGVNRVETLLKSGNPTPDEAAAIQSAAGKAHGTRMAANVGKIEPALAEIPAMLADKPRIQEIIKPLSLIAQQLAAAQKAQATADQILTEWKEDDSSSPWGWEEDMMLNPAGSIEYTCLKIMGAPDKEPSTSRNYFAQKLISEKEKGEATEILTKEGKKAAAFFLESVIETNMAAIEKSAATNMPPLINSLRETLQEVVSASHSEKTKSALENGPVGQLLKDRVKFRILEKKIRSQAIELAKTKGTTRSIPLEIEEKDKEAFHKLAKEKGTAVALKEMENSVKRGGEIVTHEQLGHDIIPGKGASEPVAIRVDATGTKITTNKPWANGWLKTEKGRQNVMEHLNTMNWIKSSGTNPKTALAFLNFCRQRFLPVADAIAAGGVSETDQKAIKTALGRFEYSLKTLGINPEEQTLRTTLIAGSAISQYCSARFSRGNPWREDWEKDLEGITPKDVTGVTIAVGYEPSPEGATKIASPFKNEEAVEENELETQKKMVKSAARAVGSIFKPLGM